MTSGAGGAGGIAMLRVRFAVLDCAGLPESVTLNVTVAPAAAAVGVPLMAPLDVFSVRPLGSAPCVIDHESGPVPPLAVSVAE
jgi:hypothetical protein